MASKFTITAELNLQTKNLNQVVNNLKQQFQGANLNIKIKDLAQAESQLRGMSKEARSASQSMGLLGSSISQGVKKFSIITIATGTFVGLTRGIKNAVGDAIEFEREMVKIAQATGKTVSQLRGLETEIGKIATTMGASSKELLLAARTLTQAGFAADKVTGSLKILAQTELAATFDSIADTTEGVIALLNQFGRQAQQTGNEVAFLEKSLSAINQVSKEFAVESSDLITAIRTTGSAFEASGGSLEELIALFTSVRSTTRESAESIATGFRTIFTRVQRVDTINQLRALGIELQDASGKFVGPMEAAKRLSAALNTIDPKDFRFNLIVEQLGGFRQVSKVIPLIQQFSVAQRALSVAQGASGSLAKDAATAQQSLGSQIQKTREEFSRFIRDLTQTSSFQGTVRTLLDMASAFIKVADTLKPLIPLIASFAALKIGTALLPTLGVLGNGVRKKSEGGPIHKFASGGMVPGSGNGDTVPAMLTPGEFVIRKSSVKKLGADNLARANKYGRGGAVQFYEDPAGQVKENDLAKQKNTKLRPSSKTHFTHLDMLRGSKSGSIAQYYSSFGIDLPANWNIDWSQPANKRGITQENLQSYVKSKGKNIFQTMLNQRKSAKTEKTIKTAYGITDPDQLQALDNNATKIVEKFVSLLDNGKGKFLDTDIDVITKQIPRKFTQAVKSIKDVNLLPSFNRVVSKRLKDTTTRKKLSPEEYQQFNDPTRGRSSRNLTQTQQQMKATFERRKKFWENQKSKKDQEVENFALGGPAGKSRAARAITIPRIDSYTFDKPAGADLDATNSKKQQYKLNAEDRLDYDVDNVNVDVSKLKVSKDLLEQYNTADDQKRGFRFEDILKETGMAKSLSQVSNARLDGITAAGDPFEAKSRKSAIGISELEDKLYGAISDNISDPEKLARARFNANDLTEKEDHIKIGKVTVFEDVTKGLGAAVKSKARMGYAEEEAAKQAKEQSKMTAVNAQERLKGLVDKNFSSGYKIFGTQYNPIKAGTLHPDVASLLNKKLGGSYKDKFAEMSDEQVIDALNGVIVRRAMGGGNLGTDTVPAMLTPGEYVINKKSAQAIGYGALNRMNKVGKFAEGGPVQFLNTGSSGSGVTRMAPGSGALQAAFPLPKGFGSKVAAAGNIPSSTGNATAQSLQGVTQSSNNLKEAFDKIIQKESAVSSNLILMAGVVSSVTANMTGMDKEITAAITAFTGTFAAVNGVGQSLKGMVAQGIASTVTSKQQTQAVSANSQAVAANTAKVKTNTASGSGPQSPQGAGSATPSKAVQRFEVGMNAMEGVIAGFSAGVAVDAARAAVDAEKASKANDKLTRAMEKFATSAENEAEVRQQMIATLVASERSQARSNASTSGKAIGGGFAGGLAGAATGAAIGSAIAPGVGTAIGAFFGGAAGALGGQQAGSAMANKFDEKKVQESANKLATVFTISAKAVKDANKYLEGIDKQNISQVNGEFEKMSKKLLLAQQELDSFDTKDLETASAYTRDQFNRAADAVGNFEQTMGKVSGALLAKIGQEIGNATQLGVNYNIKTTGPGKNEQLSKTLDVSQKTIADRFDKKIAAASTPKEKASLEDQKATELAKNAAEFNLALAELKLSAMQQVKAMMQEKAMREAIVGTLQEENALRTMIERFSFSLEKATKASDNIDAAFSGTVSALKSSLPDPKIFDLKSPDTAEFQSALDVVAKIGPIGQKLATNLADLNKVTPNFEETLLNIKIANPNDIQQTIKDVITKGFKIDLGSDVGKALEKQMLDTLSNKNAAENDAGGTAPNVQDPETIKKLKDQVEAYAAAMKESAKGVLENMASAEQEQKAIIDKIVAAEQRKLDLQMQMVDSYERLTSAIGKATGKGVSLAEKNAMRSAKMFVLLGNDANKSIPQIGAKLKDLRDKLQAGAKNPQEFARIANQAKNLEQALKTLANQSDRTSDTLEAIEKIKAQREAVTTSATGYAFGNDEARKSKDDAAAALQQVMAAGGDLDAISEEMRPAVEGLLGELGDAGAQVKKQLAANFYEKRGQTGIANMIRSESSSPEQALIRELRNIYAEEIASQVELMKQEQSFQDKQITALNLVTLQINAYTGTLKQIHEEAMAKAKAAGEAANPKGVKPMTIADVNKEITGLQKGVDAFKTLIEGLTKTLGEINAEWVKIKEEKAKQPPKQQDVAVPPQKFFNNPGPVFAAPKAKGGLVYLADGGSIFQPKGTDTVPAMLTPGEFVIKKSSVDAVGVDTLSAINNGYAKGGLVSYLQRGGQAGWGNMHANETQRQNDETTQRMLADPNIRQTLMNLNQQAQEQQPMMQQQQMQQQQMQQQQPMMQPMMSPGMAYGMMMNQRYASGGNGTRRQLRARARADKSREQKAAKDDANYFSVPNAQEQQADMEASTASVNQMMGNANASSDLYGLKPGASVIPPVPPQQAAATAATAAAATATPPPETAVIPPIPPAVAVPVPPQQEAATTATAAEATATLPSAGPAMNYTGILDATNDTPPKPIPSVIAAPKPPQQEAAVTATAAAATDTGEWKGWKGEVSPEATPMAPTDGGPQIMSTTEQENRMENPNASEANPRDKLALDIAQQEHDQNKADAKAESLKEKEKNSKYGIDLEERSKEVLKSARVVDGGYAINDLNQRYKTEKGATREERAKNDKAKVQEVNDMIPTPLGFGVNAKRDVTTEEVIGVKSNRDVPKALGAAIDSAAIARKQLQDDKNLTVDERANLEDRVARAVKLGVGDAVEHRQKAVAVTKDGGYTFNDPAKAQPAKAKPGEVWDTKVQGFVKDAADAGPGKNPGGGAQWDAKARAWVGGNVGKPKPAEKSTQDQLDMLHRQFVQPDTTAAQSREIMAKQEALQKKLDQERAVQMQGVNDRVGATKAASAAALQKGIKESQARVAENQKNEEASKAQQQSAQIGPEIPIEIQQQRRDQKQAEELAAIEEKNQKEQQETSDFIANLPSNKAKREADAKKSVSGLLPSNEEIGKRFKTGLANFRSENIGAAERRTMQEEQRAKEERMASPEGLAVAEENRRKQTELLEYNKKLKTYEENVKTVNDNPEVFTGARGNTLDLKKPMEPDFLRDRDKIDIKPNEAGAFGSAGPGAIPYNVAEANSEAKIRQTPDQLASDYYKRNNGALTEGIGRGALAPFDLANLGVNVTARQFGVNTGLPTDVAQSVFPKPTEDAGNLAHGLGRVGEAAGSMFVTGGAGSTANFVKGVGADVVTGAASEKLDLPWWASMGLGMVAGRAADTKIPGKVTDAATDALSKGKDKLVNALPSKENLSRKAFGNADEVPNINLNYDPSAATNKFDRGFDKVFPRVGPGIIGENFSNKLGLDFNSLKSSKDPNKYEIPKTGIDLTKKPLVRGGKYVDPNTGEVMDMLDETPDLFSPKTKTQTPYNDQRTANDPKTMAEQRARAEKIAQERTAAREAQNAKEAQQAAANQAMRDVFTPKTPEAPVSTPLDINAMNKTNEATRQAFAPKTQAPLQPYDLNPIPSNGSPTTFQPASVQIPKTTKITAQAHTPSEFTHTASTSTAPLAKAQTEAVAQAIPMPGKAPSMALPAPPPITSKEVTKSKVFIPTVEPRVTSPPVKAEPQIIDITKVNPLTQTATNVATQSATAPVKPTAALSSPNTLQTTSVNTQTQVPAGYDPSKTQVTSGQAWDLGNNPFHMAEFNKPAAPKSPIPNMNVKSNRVDPNTGELVNTFEANPLTPGVFNAADYKPVSPISKVETPVVKAKTESTVQATTTPTPAPLKTRQEMEEWFKNQPIAGDTPEKLQQNVDTALKIQQDFAAQKAGNAGATTAPVTATPAPPTKLQQVQEQLKNAQRDPMSYSPKERLDAQEAEKLDRMRKSLGEAIEAEKAAEAGVVTAQPIITDQPIFRPTKPVEPMAQPTRHPQNAEEARQQAADFRAEAQRVKSESQANAQQMRDDAKAYRDAKKAQATTTTPIANETSIPQSPMEALGGNKPKFTTRAEQLAYLNAEKAAGRRATPQSTSRKSKTTTPEVPTLKKILESQKDTSQESFIESFLSHKNTAYKSEGAHTVKDVLARTATDTGENWKRSFGYHVRGNSDKDMSETIKKFVNPVMRGHTNTAISRLKTDEEAIFGTLKMGSQQHGPDVLREIFNKSNKLNIDKETWNKITKEHIEAQSLQTWGDAKNPRGVPGQELIHPDYKSQQELEELRHGYASGGLVSYLAKGGSTDTIPAMLTPGEFVMSKGAVDTHGKAFMEHLNRGGTVKGFASGGEVSYLNRGGGPPASASTLATVANRKKRREGNPQRGMNTAEIIQNQMNDPRNQDRLQMAARGQALFANSASGKMAQAATNNARGQMQGSVNNTMGQMQQANNNAQQAMGGGGQQQGGGGGGQQQQGGGGGAGMPNMEALSKFAESFSGFTTQLTTLAETFKGLTVNHTVTFDGQINIAGFDSKKVSDALQQGMEVWVKDQILKLAGGITDAQFKQEFKNPD